MSHNHMLHRGTKKVLEQWYYTAYSPYVNFIDNTYSLE